MTQTRRLLVEAVQDARFALRVLRRKPAFTAAALVSLALGVGVNTAVFSIADSMLFRPLDAAHPEELVSIYHQNPQGATISSSWPDYEYYRDHNQVFSGLAAYLRVPMVFRATGAAEQIRGELVSTNFFSVLGVRPIIGRALREDDKTPVAVLSHGFWQRRFAGDPTVAGRTIFLGGHAFTVVGVSPNGFGGVVMDWGGAPDLWVPIHSYREAVSVFQKLDVPRAWFMQSFPLVGRLRQGVPLERARAGLALLSSQAAPLREAALKRRIELSPIILPLQQARFWPTYRPAAVRFLSVMTGIAVLLLLIACLNVAGLLVALASERRKEVMVRLALGVSRARLLRQLLVESFLLSAMGGVAGLLVAEWTTRFLIRFPGALGAPVVLRGGLDSRAFGFALLFSAISGVLAGLAPIRYSLRMSPADYLKRDRVLLRGPSVRGVLLASQVALSLVVLAGAGLFIRSLDKVQDQDVVPGPGRLLLAKFDLGSWGYAQPRAASFQEELLERVRALPGVQGAALVSIPPLSGQRSETEILTAEGQRVKVNLNVISDAYFRVTGLPLMRGREFASLDRKGAPRVAVINEQAVELLFPPGRDPLGQRLRLPGSTVLVEIIGVVRDGRFRNLREPIRPCMYYSLGQEFRWGATLEVRSAAGPIAAAAAVRKAVSAMDRELPLTDVMTWEEHRNLSLGQERLAAALLSGLGVLSLLLAAAGVYGIVSFTVIRRTREMGIRTALGAHRRDVLRAAVAPGLWPVLAGAGVGMGIAFVLTQRIAALLYETSPADAVVFACACLLLVAIAAAAACLPALRAARINPAEALRYE